MSDEEPVLEPGGAGIGPGRLGRQPLEHDRRVLERLALEQAGEQQVALLPQGQLVVEVEVGLVGQQSPRLQLDERRRDEQELGGDLEVELLELGQLGQVGVDDGRQRHLVEVDLLAQDEVEQQIEGPLEHRGLHRVGHPVTIEGSSPTSAHASAVPRLAHSGRVAPATVAAVAVGSVPIRRRLAVALAGATCMAVLLAACGGSGRATLSPSAAAQTIAAIYKLSPAQQRCLTNAFDADRAATRPLASDGPATDADLTALGTLAETCIPASTLSATIVGGAGGLTATQQACVRTEVAGLGPHDRATLLAGLAVPNVLGDIQTALLGKITQGVLDRCHISLPDITETDTTPTTA